MAVLGKRQCYNNVNGYYYCGNTTTPWNDWGRWVLVGVIVFLFFLLLLVFCCCFYSSRGYGPRRRRSRGRVVYTRDSRTTSSMSSRSPRPSVTRPARVYRTRR